MKLLPPTRHMDFDQAGTRELFSGAWACSKAGGGGCVWPGLSRPLFLTLGKDF